VVPLEGIDRKGGVLVKKVEEEGRCGRRVVDGGGGGRLQSWVEGGRLRGKKSLAKFVIQDQITRGRFTSIRPHHITSSIISQSQRASVRLMSPSRCHPTLLR
jgi:hypothetical protein